MIGILHLHFLLPGCLSLKEKRSRIKPLIHRLHREFNVSIAEMDLQDKWNESVMDCACIANDNVHCQQVLQSVVNYIPGHFREIEILEHHIELI